MRIIFVGTVDFSRHCLQQVLECGGNVVAVFTLAKEDASFHSDYVDLSDVASRHGAPVYRIKNINEPKSLELISSLQPDVIFVFGWSKLIAKQVLEIPSKGCIGTHPALLPKNRGRHPIIWALVEGLRESGLTFFYMDEGADSGDILWQKSLQIFLEDDAGSLYEKIKALASEAIREFLPRLEQGTAPRIPQDHSRATYWRKRTEKDGEIDWSEPAMKIYNLIRGLTHPYVGAHTYSPGRTVKIWRAMLPKEPLPPEAQDLKAGSVFASTGPAFDVRTIDGYLTVLDYEVAGGGLIEVGIKLGGQP